MALPIRIKYPGEARVLAFDFSSKLRAGASLAGAATVTPSPGLTVGAPSSDLTTGIVTVLVSGGALNNDYTVTCQHGTSTGETLILVATVEIRADAN